MIQQSGALLERMATSGVDIVSLDWTVTVPEARKRIGNDIGIQAGTGNVAILSYYCDWPQRYTLLQGSAACYTTTTDILQNRCATVENRATWTLQCCLHRTMSSRPAQRRYC
eukprot:12727-Heterococcus_DN1.PRE.1